VENPSKKKIHQQGGKNENLCSNEIVCWQSVHRQVCLNEVYIHDLASSIINSMWVVWCHKCQKRGCIF